MNNPGSILDGLYLLGGNNNKIYSRITRMLTKHYCPNGIIIEKKLPSVQRFVVNREKLGEFFRDNKVTHIFINEYEERMEDQQYKTSGVSIVDKTNVIVNCIVGI
tara:strand:+ start:1901 stop:2215 length:315 start_codon:yes stop_codon:yes gene_type:complete